jgi:hypothetical protein
MPPPIFYTCIIIFGLVVALYYYYLWRIEFVHKFLLLEPKWANRLNNPKEKEGKILATKNNELIKDYYFLLNIRRLVFVVAFLSFPIFLYSLFLKL